MKKGILLTLLAIVAALIAVIVAPIGLVETGNPFFILVGFISSGTFLGLIGYAIEG